jgi:hypothetical protein
MSLFLMLFHLFSWAIATDQNYKYKMEGSFRANLPGLLRFQDVRFTVFWNEKNGTLRGVYQDDLFTNATSFVGSSSSMGKVFSITLPAPVHNVMKLSLTTIADKMDQASIPLMIFMQDRLSMTVDEITTTAKVEVRNVIGDETPLCEEGFGELRGYCGTYKGKILEIIDPGNYCQLPEYGFRLVLSPQKRVDLFFYYSETTIGIPTHSLGLIETLPLAPYLSVSEKHCGTLVGTNFEASHCQTLKLSGNLSKLGNVKRFNGTYSILDQTTKEGCTYSLILEEADSVDSGP